VSAAGEAHADRAARWLLDALGVELPGDLLVLALTHRSFAYENGGLPTNERLEFLGDSVLGLVVTDELYRSSPDLPEGQLAKLRASVVNMTSLAAVARRLGPEGIGPQLLLGRGEEATGGREKDSILADAVEALLGAIHLEDQPPGTRGRPGARCPPLHRRRRRPRPRQGVHRVRGALRGRLRKRHRADQEGRRAGGRRDRLAGVDRRRREGLTR
jgi:hypothetical protein